MKKIIKAPFKKEDISDLKAGDKIYIEGTIYTARDAAHQRLLKSLDAGEKLPIDIEGAVIYYCGPSPARPGQVIGSAGPTTSGRMDSLTIPLLEKGMLGMIGKGERSLEVEEAIKENKAVYMVALGGAGALMAKSIEEATVVAYEDLGAEAIRELKVFEFPVIVVIDSEGNNLYRMGRKQYEVEEG